MTLPPRATLISWGVAALLLLFLATRVLGAGASADPAPITLEGGQAAAPGAAGEAAGPDGTGEPRGTGGGGDQGGLFVHVAGAVAEPGVYRVPEGSRVAAAVDAAGGPARRADLAGVNLAAPLQDGQQVIVPARARAGTPAPAAPPGGAAPAAGPGAAPGAKVRLSTATVEQLDALDGIGPTLAQRIVEYRVKNGGFRSIDELREVEGIGEKRFESLREAVEP